MFRHKSAHAHTIRHTPTHSYTPTHNFSHLKNSQIFTMTHSHIYSSKKKKKKNENEKILSFTFPATVSTNGSQSRNWLLGAPLRYASASPHFLPVCLGLLGSIHPRLVYGRVVPALVVLAVMHQCPHLLVQLPVGGNTGRQS